ncbi:MAG: cysteine desulfurase family protein [Bacillota bacterium]|nr:cysteine desulfurase family protein [Bacillota bacterium]
MIYFDNSATTKPYAEVLDSFFKISNDFFGNPSSLHGLGSQSEKLLSQARIQMANLLNVKPGEIIFTSGGTESNNFAIKGAAFMYKKRGNHLITSSVEHPSVSKAMEQLEELGFEVTYLPVDKNGKVQVEDVERAIRKDTILISVMHVNNEVGTVQPIREVGKLLEKYPNILFHVDAVQGIGKMDLPLKDFGVDMCSISAHKFHGLKGTGALFVREGVGLTPLLSGGEQERNMRSGTENVAGAVAMAKALRMTMEKKEKGIEKMKNVQRGLIDDFGEMEGIIVHTQIESASPHIVNFSVPGIKSEVFIHALEQEHIFVSTTSACSSKKKSPSKTLLAMGVPEPIADSSIRISLSYENTEEEAAAVLNAIKRVVNKLRKVMN